MKMLAYDEQISARKLMRTGSPLSSTVRIACSAPDPAVDLQYAAHSRPRSTVDEFMTAHFSTTGNADVDRYLVGPLGEFLLRPGKRLRPLLCRLACVLVGGQPDDALSASTALECFHGSALIHDDIEDDGVWRRGAAAFHRTEGIPLAINAGDYGLALTYKLVLDDPRLDDAVKLAVVCALTEMAELTIKGQAIDLGWSRDGRFDVSVEDYLIMARGKSAYYTCAYPLVVGAIIGKATKRQQETLKEAGAKFGTAFQIEDDLSNLRAQGGTGKDELSDIVEGKRTLMVAYALAKSPDAEELATILASHPTGAQVTRALEIMNGVGALEYAASISERLCTEALDLLAGEFESCSALHDLEQVIRSIPSAWKKGCD